ncbi:hypothetical protein MMYC01_205326 [Madurella mycetomatis]|uniref:Uncharacterized protein n=1 Tax=Madurella mycetomatis TaxID=100816 RepID=A0A175VYG2_9PEZI|nr:hypothetical protein MMYC01_205326 [Madurella mycetomatis]
MDLNLPEAAITRFATAHTALAATVWAITATYIFFSAVLQLAQDAKKPTLVATTIPFLSPILGMIRWSMGFYRHMRCAVLTAACQVQH